MNLPSTIYLIWLMFFFYCVAGYIVECTYCSIPAGHFINRGFLNGPYLPIYGSGAIVASALFGQLTNPLMIFLLGGTMCCALEWITSWAMEKLYHARWWDYSDKPLNLQGRIWIGGFVEFGLAIVLVILGINPPLIAFLEQLSAGVTIPLAIATLLCMGVDLVISHIGASKMREKMDRLKEETRERAKAMAEETRQRASEFATQAHEHADEVAAERKERREERAAQAEADADQRRQEAEELRMQALADAALYEEKLDERRAQAEAKASERRERWKESHRQAIERRRQLMQQRRELAQSATWERMLRWNLGKRLRLSDSEAESLRPDLPQLSQIEGPSRRFRDGLSPQERRMLKAFPNMLPSDYKEMASELAQGFESKED